MNRGLKSVNSAGASGQVEAGLEIVKQGLLVHLADVLNELHPVEVDVVVRAATGMLGAQFLSRGLELECEFAEALPLVSANPFSLEEVVINLMLNARDAVEERLETGSDSARPRVLLRTLLDREGPLEQVKIEVIDSGVGIPPDILPKVFDPFFTTKEPDKGTGLGLSISKSIVERFGGTIRIQSMPGRGTTVTISLPAEKHRSREDQ